MSVYRVGTNKSSTNVFPSIRPSLDLDFANTKTLDPRITFTRASGGSYVGADGLIKYAGVNEPRFTHDPETGESLGLLVEEARTNLKIRSEEIQFDFSRVAISSISQDEIISPDGTLNADGIVPNNTLSAHYIDKVFTSTSGITASQNICCSAFFKKGVGRDALLQVYEESGNAAQFLRFNFETETLTLSFTTQYNTGGGVTSGYGVIKYPNGWYRLWVAGYPNTTTTGRRLRIRVVNETGSGEFSGDTISSYVYVWGVQVEIEAFPTSYIPTRASTRTRAADIASITGKNFSDFYNLDEGSIFVDFLNTPNSASFPIIYSFYDPITGAGQNRVQLVKFTEVYNIRITDVSNGLAQSAYNIASGYKVFDNIKVFRTYGFKNYIGSVNGTTPRPPGTFNTTNPTPSKLISALNIGSGENGSTPINAPVKRFTYYPKALPPSQLQALTS
jgi:hypothetical protein